MSRTDFVLLCIAGVIFVVVMLCLTLVGLLRKQPRCDEIYDDGDTNPYGEES